MCSRTAIRRESAHDPEERAEIAQMLRVTIDPVRPEKNLQIAEQMADDEQHQNDAGDRDDHFLADGGAIKGGEVGHAEIRLAVLSWRSTLQSLDSGAEPRRLGHP